MDEPKSEDIDSLFEEDPGLLDEEEEDADDLKLDKLETKIWLVKVPAFLAERWNAVDQEGLDLGCVRIFNQPPPGSTANISLILPDNHITTGIPKQYTINVNPGEVSNKYVFSEDDKGAATGITGTIHHECMANPLVNTAEYRSMLKQRVIEAGRPTRTVQIINEGDKRGTFLAPGAAGGVPASGFGTFVKKKVKPTLDAKATRVPRNELMDMLFEAFERYPYWSFKGIVEHTKQPASYLKEILGEICILNKRGPYTSMYQLKPEYKGRQAENAGAGPSSAPHVEEDEDMDDDDDDEEDMEMVNVE